MSSPFPGMDPYLEAPGLWPLFHHQMVVGLAEVLQPSLGERYRLQFGTRAYTTEMPLFTSVVREEHHESFAEVRQRSNNRLVTLVELISPTNRKSAEGRYEYLARRDAARKQGANLVESDLVLQGQSCLDLSTEGLPEFDYAVSVCRATRPDRYELYTTTVQKKLPRIRVPLASDDRDLVVDVQAVFTRCYGRFLAGKVDYQKPPPARLKDVDEQWMDHLLREQKLRM
jgi:hypothetical protein